MPLPTAPELHTDYKKFVDPKVITISITDDIITKIMPFFPVTSKVISGYLNEDQLYWKINYHWELLLYVAGKCAGLGDTMTGGADAVIAKKLDKQHVESLNAITTALNTSKPNPESGYRVSSKPGEPKDLSTHEIILTRHVLVTEQKKKFKKVVEDSNIFDLSKLDKKTIQLAFAPVASPKNGKHKTGYALDIKGGNAEIKKVAKSVGATMTFDELSHVHCEWKNGVDTAAANGGDSVAAAGRAVDYSINKGIQNCRHCLLRTEA
jgi:hypothetical protein